jgi:glycosyltransferase involved in cell wall biosynthesis
MHTIPITVCIIAKNEEKHIGECLKRLKPYGMELIVTDTGSSDSTKDIARRYASKVLEYEWINDFSAARNFCADNAVNDTILVLDCDEYVDKMDAEFLVKCIKKLPQSRGLLHLTSVVKHPSGEKGYATDDIVRLYNRKYYRFSGAVHEQIVPLDSDMEDVPCFPLPIEATHYGYYLTKEEMVKKQERNLSILNNQLITEGETPYTYFQIAQSEMVLEDYEGAIRDYEKALSFNPSRDITYVLSLIEGLSKAYVCVGKRGEALRIMDRYAPECSGNPRFVFYHANVLMDNNEPLKALAKYVKVITMPETDPKSYELLYSYRRIIELYHSFGEYDLAKFFEEKYNDFMNTADINSK